MEKVKVAIYCRVSTQDQDFNKQEQICKQYSDVKGWEVFRVYSDTISGAKESRPAFNELLSDLRHYKFRMVVVTKLDRMGRSLKHLISLLDEFKSKGVEFVAVTQNIDTSSSIGRLQWQILGAFAEYERSIISERTKEGLRFADNVGKRGKDKKPRLKRGVLRKSNSL